MADDVILEEQQNERRVVNWLGAIAVVAVIAATYLVASSQRTKVGVDTAVIVAFVTITGQCASSLGSRRTRLTPADGDSRPPTPQVPPVSWAATPPPYEGTPPWPTPNPPSNRPEQTPSPS